MISCAVYCNKIRILKRDNALFGDNEQKEQADFGHRTGTCLIEVKRWNGICNEKSLFCTQCNLKRSPDRKR